jgi:hypothetical protein
VDHLHAVFIPGRRQACIVKALFHFTIYRFNFVKSIYHNIRKSLRILLKTLGHAGSVGGR